MDDYTLYFVQEGTSGPIKIGCTKNAVYLRVNTMQVGNPRRLQLIAVLPVEHKGHEKLWHKRFDDVRLVGEWFHPTRALMDAIRSEAQVPGPVDATPECLQAAAHRTRSEVRADLKAHHASGPS